MRTLAMLTLAASLLCFSGACAEQKGRKKPDKQADKQADKKQDKQADKQADKQQAGTSEKPAADN